MEEVRIVSLDHSDLVRAVQQAMASQLRRDGRLRPGAELGLLFYATGPDDLQVIGRVRQGSQVLFELTGHGSLTTPKLAEQIASMKVSIKLKQAPVPEGLSQILHLLGEATTARPTGGR